MKQLCVNHANDIFTTFKMEPGPKNVYNANNKYMNHTSTVKFNFEAQL